MGKGREWRWGVYQAQPNRTQHEPVLAERGGGGITVTPAKGTTYTTEKNPEGKQEKSHMHTRQPGVQEQAWKAHTATRCAMSPRTFMGSIGSTTRTLMARSRVNFFARSGSAPPRLAITSAIT